MHLDSEDDDINYEMLTDRWDHIFNAGFAKLMTYINQGREKPMKNPGEMNYSTCCDHIKTYVLCGMNYCLFACKFNIYIIHLALFKCKLLKQPALDLLSIKYTSSGWQYVRTIGLTLDWWLIKF